MLQKKVGVNQPTRIENARVLIANTPMDTDKIKVFGSRVRADSAGKVAEIEAAEKSKMKDKVRYRAGYPSQVSSRRLSRACL